MIVVINTIKELRKLDIDVETIYLLNFPIGKKKFLKISGKELFEIVKNSR